jgi:predicted nucleic acid-binding OB-fold protein
MYPFWGYWSIPIMGLLSKLFWVAFMSDDDNKVVTLKVRVSPEFRELITDTAKANNRSMNAEIVDRLEKSFDQSSNTANELDIFLNVLERLVPGMEVNSTSNFLVELINTRKKQNTDK